MSLLRKPKSEAFPARYVYIWNIHEVNEKLLGQTKVE